MSFELLRINEASEQYGIPLETLRSWRAQGVGPRSGRVAGRVVYRRADFDEWIDAQLTATASGGVRADAA